LNVGNRQVVPLDFVCKALYPDSPA
jgi:hypothetical protein